MGVIRQAMAADIGKGLPHVYSPTSDSAPIQDVHATLVYCRGRVSFVAASIFPKPGPSSSTPYSRRRGNRPRA